MRVMERTNFATEKSLAQNTCKPHICEKLQYLCWDIFYCHILYTNSLFQFLFKKILGTYAEQLHKIG